MVILFLLLFQLLFYAVSTLFPIQLPRGLLFCGLFGFSGSRAVDVTKIRWLAMENESRGRDSTGIFVIKGNKRADTALYKDTRSARIFVDSVPFEELVPGALTLQGHTRSATVGDVSVPNAHPFDENFGLRVIGAHNGFILDKIKDVPQHESFGFETGFEVDSRLIFAVLSKFNGDLSKLGEIEGAIACSFQMPTKHGRQLFLYKGSGRELHVGITKEGLYYSSERLPLTYIGCKGVEAVPDSSVMLINDGVIVDVAPVSKPKIKFYLNAGRTTYENHLTAEERQYLGLKPVSYSPVIKYDKNSYDDYWNRYESTYPKQKKKAQVDLFPAPPLTHKYQDELYMLIKDVKQEVEALVDEPLLLDKQVNSTIEFDELQSSLLLLKLTSSPRDVVLPGWCAYDSEDDTICGVTALNGVTILNYPEKYHRTKRKILLCGPVDKDAVLFSLEFTPQAARIQEVILKLPFPQDLQGKPKGGKNTEKQGLPADRSQLGESILLSQPANIKLLCSTLPAATQTSNVLLTKDEQIHTRRAKQKDDGSVRIYSTTNKHTQGTEDVHPNTYLGSSGSKSRLGVTLPMPTVHTIVQLLREENSLFTKKKEITKLLQSQEYGLTFNTWREQFDGWLNVRMLLHDACVLKLYHVAMFNDAYTLGFYASKLIMLMVDSYAKTTRPLSEEDLKIIYNRLGVLIRFSNGSSEVGEEKKLIA